MRVCSQCLYYRNKPPFEDGHVEHNYPQPNLSLDQRASAQDGLCITCHTEMMRQRSARRAAKDAAKSWARRQRIHKKEPWWYWSRV